ARLLANCVLPGGVLAALVSAQAPPVPLPFSNVFSWYAVAADDVVHVLENDYPYATAKYTRSTDHGRTWSTPIPLFVSTALYASGRNLYAWPGTGVGFATSVDAGATWRPVVVVPGTAGATWTGVAFDGASAHLLLKNGTTLLHTRSLDGGATWSASPVAI